MPETCPSFDGCDAPLCPLSPGPGSSWFPDEPVCKRRGSNIPSWVRTQRKIARRLKLSPPVPVLSGPVPVLSGPVPALTGDDNVNSYRVGFFTVPMLRAIYAVTPKVTGIAAREQEAAWLAARPRARR